MPPNARTHTTLTPTNPTQKGSSAFPPTQWAMVAKAVAHDTPEGKEALAAICERYWLPLYAFARTTTHCSPQDAEDLTQGFLYSVLKRNSLATVVAEKGRLRSFLMTSMKNHIVSEYRRANTQLRGGGKVIDSISLDYAESVLAEDHLAYAHHAESPAQMFDRRWAIAVLDRVMQRLGGEYRDKGEHALFLQLRQHLNGRDRNTEGYDSAADALGITPTLARVRVHRMKRRYRTLLKQEIGSTVPAGEIESELKYLFSVFQC